MSSRRAEKMAHAILETVSTTILFHLKDPRVKHVTVLDVDVAGDMRSAKVHVSVMGDEKQQALCMHGLRSARGFIQSKLGNRLDTRYIPVLTFVLDQSVKKSAEASRILREVLPSDEVPRDDLTAAEDHVNADDSESPEENDANAQASSGPTDQQRSPPNSAEPQE